MRGDAEAHRMVAPGTLASVLELIAGEPGEWTPIAGGTELMVAHAAGRLPKMSNGRLVAWREPGFAASERPLGGTGMKLVALGLKELTSLLFLLSAAAVAILIAAWLHIDWDERFVTPAVAAIGVLWAWRSSRKL